MLHANSKQAHENLKQYIRRNYDPTGHDGLAEDTADFTDIAKSIMKTFESEKYYTDSYAVAYGYSKEDVFVDWCAGLPSVLDTCYYCDRSAVDDLGGILEETEEEKKRFTESQAEDKLTRMIYLELNKYSR